ncbi:helix-turn-helix domain-containing protein [Algiphilus sp.]|uniref:helix-turn-helix domain-containing protein n=3 Tax=Algiphilus sp. TaxID=1872431 RepID=UPI0025C6B94F|nr:helix-turn-helix domain-containing protein [Algiphilus sp.]MCK5769570.1 helix-turn-helix domain-containing protein [Algiphilus sp.]
MTDTETDTARPRAPEPEAAGEATAATASPGEMLREAREARGISVADLAEASKLPQATIMALECDDFEILKEPVYVRGYYRKCALTLETDVDAVVGAYERKARPAAPALPDKIPVVAGGGVSFVRRLLQLLLILVVIGLFAMVGWWLLQTPVTDGTATGDPLFGTSEEERPAAGDESGAAEAADAADATTAAPAESGAEAAPGSEAVAEAPAAGTDTGEAAGSPVLSLRFEENSWLRVRDAGGRTLINDLMNAGSSERIEGETPLTLFVGYAPGTDARWRGERVDLAAVTRSNNTAEITLE